MRHTIFLISPANLGGERAKLVFKPKTPFPLALQLRSPEGAPLGDVFSFLSGLYFRGKIAYAAAFGRPPKDLTGGLVISAGSGLRFPHERVTLARLAEWADVEIDGANEAFTRPLLEHATALERAHGATTRFVLLGSVATDKYVQPLTSVFGARLLFPTDFVGRGDMSRGALLLRAVRAGEELAYEPIASAQRHGPRAPGVAQHRLHRATARQRALEVVVLIGLPAAGKTTFFQERFAATHVHVSKDLLGKTRRKDDQQAQLIDEALRAGRSLVVDNTNASAHERAGVIAQARAHGARVVGYVFACTTRECVARNAERAGAARIPNVGIFATAKRLMQPQASEGFDALYVVRARPDRTFAVRTAPTGRRRSRPSRRRADPPRTGSSSSPRRD